MFLFYLGALSLKFVLEGRVSFEGFDKIIYRFCLDKDIFNVNR